MLFDGHTKSVWSSIQCFGRLLRQHFDSVDPCPICYSLMDQAHKLPNMSCSTCGNRCHTSCLFKRWSTQGGSAGAALCRPPLKQARCMASVSACGAAHVAPHVGRNLNVPFILTFHIAIPTNHATICSAGSKGYCAVKEMLQSHTEPTHRRELLEGVLLSLQLLWNGHTTCSHTSQTEAELNNKTIVISVLLIFITFQCYLDMMMTGLCVY
jgi:hypothetical protein